MSTWTWLLILGFGLVKLPIALVMLWLPFRSDESLRAVADGEDGETSGEDDGGSKTLPGAPRRPSPHRPRPRPHWGGPRRPRRGPSHGAPSPAAPARTRHTRALPKRGTRVGV
jgi:hypothetical protein